MSFSEGITFEDDLAMWQAGIDVDDGRDGVPEEVDEDETTPLPSEPMAVVVEEQRR